MIDYVKKCILFEIIFSSFIILSILALIVLIIMIRVKKPEKLKEYKVNDISITTLESFDFIDDIEIPEYTNNNIDTLGLTGKLILNCTTGTCTNIIRHKDVRSDCDEKGSCVTRDDSWTEYRKIIDHYCSEQCYDNYTKDYCDCNDPYEPTGTCERKYNDIYQDGKICYANNVIYFWKKRKINNLKTHDYSYLQYVKLKDEECPKGTKFCGILDNDEKKLCISQGRKCPINYISEKKLNNNYATVKIGDKTFYYGNDDTTNRKIISGIFADTDLYLNKDNYEKEVIDDYTIKNFLDENKYLYKGINLGYDPYNNNNINTKGKSYLKIFYDNKNIDLVDLREQKEIQIYNHKMNSKSLDSINYKTRVITILGLITLGLLLIAFIIFLSYQCFSFKRGRYGSNWKQKMYVCPIVIFIILFIVPLIFGCINITKAKNAEIIDANINYSTFKKLNIAFIIIGFTLIFFLIIKIILPIIFFKCCKGKDNIIEKNIGVNNNNSTMNNNIININNISNKENQDNKLSNLNINMNNNN